MKQIAHLNDNLWLEARCKTCPHPSPLQPSRAVVSRRLGAEPSPQRPLKYSALWQRRVERRRREEAVARRQWGIDDIPDQQGKLAVVPGMISGINYHAPHALALHEAQVVLAVRNVERGQATADTFQRERPEADGLGRRAGPRPGRSRYCVPRRGDGARPLVRARLLFSLVRD